MEIYPSLLKVLLALGIGLLVGLQRERATSRLAGIRTIPIAALLGAVCGMVAQSFDGSGWFLAAGLLAVTGLLVAGNLLEFRQGTWDPGMTTELAVLLVYAIGAYLVLGSQQIAVIIGGVLVLLLHLKEPMHSFAKRVGSRDFSAIVQFAVVTLIVLPVLPNRTFGPYEVLNPRQIWWMVVLIVGISLAGYVAYRRFGSQAGSVLAGILGGLISSTATTVSYGRRSKISPGSEGLTTLVLLIASVVVFLRVLLETTVVGPSLLPQLAPRLGILMVPLVAGIAVYAIPHRSAAAAMPAQKNPTEITSALVFGALYGGVLFATAAVKETFGGEALWIVAAASGLTDMDAITLSSARLAQAGALETGTAWRLIVIAGLANLVFKAGIIAALGSRGLFRRVATVYGLTLVAGAAILLF